MMDWEFWCFYFGSGIPTTFLLMLWMNEMDRGIEDPIFPKDGRITIGTVLKVIFLIVLFVWSLGGLLILGCFAGFFFGLYKITAITLVKPKERKVGMSPGHGVGYGSDKKWYGSDKK